MNLKKQIFKLYNLGFKKYGKNFQRLYPNEEFCRFLGRNYFNIKKSKRKKLKMLEVGVGNGANLSVVSSQGFRAYGIDLSSKSIEICKKVFKDKKLNGNFKIGDMTALPFKTKTFDCVIDVFSSSLLSKKDGEIFLQEVSRILKPGGKFFSYFPSKKSKMFKSKKKKLYDSDTIIKLNEKKAIYTINNSPMRFLEKKQYIKMLKKNKLKSYYSEELMKTYFNGKDYFYFLIMEAIK